MSPAQTVTQKITTMLSQLNQGLVERDVALKAALLTLLAGENLILVGPPGTAKSVIARRVAEVLKAPGEGSGYFEYLLTKFSTPEEIFGPLSIAELKADRFKRNTAGYLPTVRVAFLDEIFKASSSILNALLTILNERKFHNGAKAEDVELQALIAASNELPTGQEELSALYDRFLMRVFVDYVSEDSLPLLFEAGQDMPAVTPFTQSELDAVQKAAQAVVMPAEIAQAVQRIWREHREAFKEDRREQLSDRRLRKVIHLLRVSAATNGRKEVDFSDIVLLKNCLWNVPENAGRVLNIITGVLKDSRRMVPEVANSVSGALPKPLPQSVKSASERTVVKGYKGSGTREDPILIEDIHNLAGLERPEIGLKGYYFRQTVDIDCSPLTTWHSIEFNGHYDGGGYYCKFKIKDVFFSKLYPQSSVTNLCLEKMFLAFKADDCEIIACSVVGNSLIGSAVNCRIIACQSEQHLVFDSARKCEISGCKSGRSLICDSAFESRIIDCIADIDWGIDQRSYRSSGIVGGLAQKCSIERCLVVGKFESRGLGLKFSGIASSCEDGVIKGCALGSFTLKSLNFYGVVDTSFEGRIADVLSGASTLQNNIALDSIKGTSDDHGRDGKSLSAALFSQHYFEHTLSWDFSNIWQWDNAKSHPILQSVGVGSKVYYGQTNSAGSSTNDLLAQQMRSNLWL